MRKLFIVAASLAALALPTAALAGTGTPGGTSGNGTQVTHINVAYIDAFYGPVSCTGVHQEKKGKTTQENFTCTSTSGSPLTNLSAGQTFTTPYGWNSDATGAAANSFTGTVSADGMSYSAVATY